MLTKLEIKNNTVLSDGIAFDPSGSAATDLIQIRGITGLDPVTAALSSTPYGTVDGESFTGASVGKRNIVITVGFLANPFSGFTLADLREITYRYFMPKSNLTLTFERYGMPTVQIDGIVENVESNHFTKDPEVQISIICHSPHFRGINEITVTGRVQDVTRDQIGDYSPITCVGNLPVGFKMTIDGAVGSILDDWHLKTLLPTQQIFALYEKTISTVSGIRFSSQFRDRYIIDTAGTSLLARVAPGSDWPVLYPGTNLLMFIAQTQTFSAVNAPVWALSYYDLYGGI